MSRPNTHSHQASPNKGANDMQAIELETEIDENHEIHLKLPDDVQAGKAKVVVMYESPATTDKPDVGKSVRTFGQFPGAITMSDDFDAELPDEFWLGGNP